ncbi:MAG: DNA polymerase III subunit gamma/tau [Limnospira sp. PMC 1291.21]|uniref:DNA polymerase III subunit gamma/tau n=3 Tax=Limnospira TaxID=2596745 RepID=B5VV45_LIMMA|nr:MULTISPECIES: DNA polymerase III subunit gamma/tau [Limnospira]EKD11489.1 DNA polymerase III subunits gamma and tau [Arthrospira platensis C1]MDC0837613.1 DNA polymerase III subunit gamma/tau [Limnoraphis robusta]MDY7055086.1 DNA polymerase III subunit gamma/tau [Limnospira fusiformis LS22]QJB27651.1 DNA polymerase III subunit gamma/tau [Limnospira fusiformis SAG 85.79]EDZ96890.1 DNA polymerase III, subunits gamma and tau [Limnospira maxima CS-328]
MTYEPLHHKYRPQTFADLVGQEAIAQTLTNAIRSRRIAPAYLFTGPRGTGKTSSARILAKSLNCLQTSNPTETPCGICEVCRGITTGATLDFVEIDAASNTGVDHIRDLIERTQFSPVQCRYKVYVIDECLTGDALILSDRGWLRIDDPTLQECRVLSYNESTQQWEWQQVLRWLDQGVRETWKIKTFQTEIKCTGNHLIRTDKGWIKAANITPKMKILSPEIDAAVKTALQDVESIEKLGVNHVYDIEVEHNHNFVANGLLVHNCHMLSTAAFNALLKTLEEPPDRVVFVLATTDPQRVLPTIISRCQRFDFRRIPLQAMATHLETIAAKENIAITPEAVMMVAQIAQGGLRDAESLLDQLSLLSGEITVERVWDLVGAVPERDLMTLLEAIAEGKATAILDQTRELLNRGREPLIVLQNLGEFYRDLLIAKTAPNRQDLVKLTQPTWESLCAFSQRWEHEIILAGQKHLRDSEVQIKNTTQPRLWLEVTLLGLLPEALRPQTVSTGVVNVQPQPISNQPTSKMRSQPVYKPPAPAQPVSQAVSVPDAPPPPPPPPQPTTANQEEAVNYSLEELWEQILSAIEQLGTQALMRQHGCLRSHHGNVVCIGLKSHPLLKIAQAKISSLEVACQKVFNTKIQVNLEVGMGAVSPGVHPEKTPISQRVQSPPPPPPEPPPPTREPETERPPELTTPKIEDISVKVADNDNNSPVDDVATAAEKLAEFFDGEIIPWYPENTQVTTVSSSSVALEDTIEFYSPEDDDSEDDVPF